MTDTETVYWVVTTGLTVPDGPETSRVALRGETFTVTPEVYENSLDRNGVSWLDMDEDTQRRRWGVVRFLPGEPPSDVEIGDDDSSVVAARRERARQDALKITDRREQIAAMLAIEERFGRVLTSKSLGHVPGTKY